MECLFKTNSKITYKEYKKFAERLLIDNKGFMIFSILFLLMLAFAWVVYKDVAYLVYAVMCPLVFLIIHTISIKRTFASNKTAQNLDSTFEFFDTYVVAINDMGQSKFMYENLHKIIETKTNFYLMIGNNQGCVLVKENMSEEHENFVRDLKEKYCKKVRRKK